MLAGVMVSYPIKSLMYDTYRDASTWSVMVESQKQRLPHVAVTAAHGQSYQTGRLLTASTTIFSVEVTTSMTHSTLQSRFTKERIFPKS